MKRAWYDLRDTGILRDCFILLHVPYTLWHLAYVVIGASLVSEMNWATLGWTLFAFFLAMGVGAHCLDELQGRPLQTGFTNFFLWAVALLSISGAVAIGAVVGVRETGWVIPCIIFGGFVVFAYNLELFKGFFHTDFWFAFAWGAFPVITAYVAQTHSIDWPVAVVAVACLFYSLAQRVLSKQVRFWRRKVLGMTIKYETEPGPLEHMHQNWDKGIIIGAPEQALKLMTWAVIMVAVGLMLI